MRHIIHELNGEEKVSSAPSSNFNSLFSHLNEYIFTRKKKLGVNLLFQLEIEVNWTLYMHKKITKFNNL